MTNFSKLLLIFLLGTITFAGCSHLESKPVYIDTKISANLPKEVAIEYLNSVSFILEFTDTSVIDPNFGVNISYNNLRFAAREGCNPVMLGVLVGDSYGNQKTPLISYLPDNSENRAKIKKITHSLAALGASYHPLPGFSSMCP